MNQGSRTLKISTLQYGRPFRTMRSAGLSRQALSSTSSGKRKEKPRSLTGKSDDTLTVLCAHGNEKHLEYNAELVQMNKYLHENYDNVHVAVMEGTPEFDPVMKAAEEQGYSKVQFITFMLTYGDHMSKDVMGNEEDSMKSRLGMPADCTDGLASHEAIQDIFINNMKLVMDQF